MFARGSDGVYQSSLLLAVDWLSHGFGTRLSEGWPGEYLRIRQIHSANAVLVGSVAPREEGDAIVTSTPGNWIGIRTADCVPVLMADPRGQCVAAVHAGWRGTVANISGTTVRTLETNFGSSSQDLIAAIGPCIGLCCFEVGNEVSEQFRDLFPESLHLRHVDLAEANRRQLIAAGLRRENIDIASVCTMCESSVFHSYRRDREKSGRMVSAVRINQL